jgi:hypothetical protein
MHIMPGLSITEIKPIRAADGGFEFKVNFTGPIAFGQLALIEFGTSFGQGVNRAATVDVSDGLRGKTNWTGSIKSFALLGEVLACLGRNRLMEKPVKARGVIWTNERSVIASPTSQTFDAPVAPVSVASRRLAEQEFGLTYSGKDDGSGDGSLLFRVTGKSEIAANHYFVHAGTLVTNPAKRGFDCTTFLSAALGINSNMMGMTSGEAVAAQANKTRLLHKVKRDAIVADVNAAAFDRNAVIVIHSGTSDATHHCVLTHQRQVYEFNLPGSETVGLTPPGSKGGFITDIDKWRTNPKHEEFFSLYA